MLHNALVALALTFLDDTRFRDLKARQYFADKAKSFLEDECQKPNISVVQALSFIGSFHSSQGDQTLGYLYFGAFVVNPFHMLNNFIDRNERPSFSSS